MKCPTLPVMEIKIPHIATSSAHKTLIPDQIIHSLVWAILGTGSAVWPCHVSWPESRCIYFPLRMRNTLKHTVINTLSDSEWVACGGYHIYREMQGKAHGWAHSVDASLQCCPVPDKNHAPVNGPGPTEPEGACSRH